MIFLLLPPSTVWPLCFKFTEQKALSYKKKKKTLSERSLTILHCVPAFRQRLSSLITEIQEGCFGVPLSAVFSWGEKKKRALILWELIKAILERYYQQKCLKLFIWTLECSPSYNLIHLSRLKQCGFRAQIHVRATPENVDLYSPTSTQNKTCWLPLMILRLVARFTHWHCNKKKYSTHDFCLWAGLFAAGHCEPKQNRFNKVNFSTVVEEKMNFECSLSWNS